MEEILDDSFLPNGGNGYHGGLYGHDSAQSHSANLVDDSTLLLSHIEVPDQVRSIIHGGPGTTASSYDAYLRAIDELRDSVLFIERVLRNGKQLIATAMATLEAQFEQLLHSSSISPDPQELKEAMLSDTAPDHIRPPEVVDGRAIDQLHAIARRLVDNGHGASCSKTYRESRGAALQNNFTAMKVLRLSQKEVQDMPWAELEENMKKWNEHMHIGMIYIAAEREACDFVLDGLEPFREQCFVDVALPCMLLLISFGLAVTTTKQSPEKLFALLDMYETTLDLHQTVQDLFAGREGDSLRSDYERLLLQLGQAARETFEKFEEAVRNQPTMEEPEESTGPGQLSSSASTNLGSLRIDTLKGRKGRLNLGRLTLRGRKRVDDDATTDIGSTVSTPASAAWASGKVHPLASYVINYVLILCNGELPYFAMLEHAVGETDARNSGAATAAGAGTAGAGPATGPSGQSPLGLGIPKGGVANVQSRIAFATRRILEALKSKLEAGANAMGDDVLAELFLMNNISYILGKIETSDAGRLLGVAWSGECGVLVEEHRARFITNSLAKLDPIFAEGHLDAATLSKRLRLFNTTLERTRQRLMSWTLQNNDLRERVKADLIRRIVERYSDFLQRNSALIQAQRSLDVNVLSVAQVEQALAGSFPPPSHPRSGSV